MDPLRFHPLYQARPWGGRALETHLGRTLPGPEPIGESWDLVDRPEAQSVVAGGPQAGQCIQQLLATHGQAIMGTGWRPGRFPLLVKWLDCRERLSLQVHPPAEVATLLQGEPKTENWYIAHARPGAAVLAGLAPGIGAAEFLAARQAGRLETVVMRHPVRTGDSIFVPSGTVHAIDAGCLILEIQQNSDTTYRVDDWGRTGLDGRPRQLHLQESLAAIDWQAPPVRVVPPGRHCLQVLAECPEFRLRRVVLSLPGAAVPLECGHPALVCVVAGQVAVAGAPSAGPGEVLLVPADCTASLAAEQPAVLVVADRFLPPPNAPLKD